jgi:putative addiction module killer protein
MAWALYARTAQYSQFNAIYGQSLTSCSLLTTFETSMHLPTEREIRIYRTADRRLPFSEWFDRLRDMRARQKIQARLARLRLGNLGQSRSVGEGVCELKIDYGSGYRVYFGQDGSQIVILLCGGDKSTQSTDIQKAKAYWLQYRQEKKNANR